MANPEHLKIMKQGVEVWNKWKQENVAEDIDLSGVDLREGNLNGIDLSSVNLRGADLNGTELLESDLNSADLSKARLNGVVLGNAQVGYANLSDATLIGANFGGSFLQRSNFRNSDLRDSNFINADLRDTDLTYTRLDGADFLYANLAMSDLSKASFKNARMGSTNFGYNDLSDTKNLDRAVHLQPSFLDIETIYRSEGKIPEAFLVGCGAPENFIQFMSSLTAKAFEYYSCFISYSSKDQDFAERLYSDLQNKGVRCWFAPEDMKIGDKIRDRIDQSIRIHDKLLLILSENSINSEWVEDEVEAAYEQERQRGKTVLFPIRLDPAVMDTDRAWASKLRRSRHVGDFTQWKEHDAYQKAFERLMRDLKAEGPAGTD